MQKSALLMLILAATLGGCEEPEEATGCLPVEADQTECPKPGDVDKGKLFTGMCGYDTVEILGNGTLEEEGGPQAGPACCYPVEVVDDDPDSEPVLGHGSRRLSSQLRPSRLTSTPPAVPIR